MSEGASTEQKDFLKAVVDGLPILMSVLTIVLSACLPGRALPML